MDEADLITAALQERLSELVFADKDTDAVTELIIEETVGWARGQGWRVYRRAPSIMRLPPPYDKQHSYLDIACARPAGVPVAIEVDHSARKRTWEKLALEADAGRVAIWVRWGQRLGEAPPGPVRMVSVQVSSRHGVHSRQTEMAAPQHSGFETDPGEQQELFG